MYTQPPNNHLRVHVLAVIRIIAIFFYFLIINAILILVCIGRPFHRDNVHFAGVLYSSMSRILGLKLEVRVPKSLSTGGPFVYICNHQNSFDLITVCRAAQKGVVTVGKKSLVWIPVFGWAYWLSGNILIDRKNKGRAHNTLNSTIEKIRQRGLSVWFFPEGTRSYGRGLLPLKSGAFRIAMAVNEPVVCVSTSNLHNKIKLNRWDNGTLIIELSEPKVLDGDHDAKYWSEYFHDHMKKNIAKLDAQVAELEKAG